MFALLLAAGRAAADGPSVADHLAAVRALAVEAEPLPGRDARPTIDRAFDAFLPGAAARKAAALERVRGYGRRIAEDQKAGLDRRCSNQIYLELVWRARYTADFEEIERRIADLEESFAREDQSAAAEQSPEDGVWGACFLPDFMRLEATVLALHDLAREGRAPAYPIQLGAQVRGPADLLAMLRRNLVSDIAAEGLDRRAQLGALASYLAQLHFKDYWQGFLNDKVRGLARHRVAGGADALREPFRAFLDAWQSPQSGYWGALYRIDGRLLRTDDLSITYHIIAYRKGAVERWPQIIETTIAMEDQPYPFGWLHEGRPNNHNFYDVVKIYRYAWPHMTPDQRRRATAQIERAVDWALTESLAPDGAFRSDPAIFSSVAADYYFGVSFLDAAGFFEPNARFWTDRPYPDAFPTCERIRDRLAAARLDHELARSARRRLRTACPPG